MFAGELANLINILIQRIHSFMSLFLPYDFWEEHDCIGDQRTDGGQIMFYFLILDLQPQRGWFKGMALVHFTRPPSGAILAPVLHTWYANMAICRCSPPLLVRTGRRMRR
ncbi:hypothetical protein TcCL_ESM10459 [Trypanosoma cruzi]|nr:hypothetical protein TcCL_ESM10459 [Trypanosoma cruzi]